MVLSIGRSAPERLLLPERDMSKIYDVSVPIVDGGLVYPGNPEIHIALQQSIAAGGSSNVSSIAFGSKGGA